MSDLPQRIGQDRFSLEPGSEIASRRWAGVPRRGIYDNMKTAVDKVKKGKGRVVNARFAAMSAHYLFDAHGARGSSAILLSRGVTRPPTT